MSVQELEKIFQDKVDAEVRIEPKDWMPEKYRQTLDPPDQPACPLAKL